MARDVRRRPFVPMFSLFRTGAKVEGIGVGGPLDPIPSNKVQRY